MTTKEKNYYENITTNLIGQKISEVYYEEINYEAIIEFWEHSTEIHSIDMNVILKLENGRILQIKWDNEFHCFGIGLEILEKMKQQPSGMKIINVSNHANWSKILNKKITGITVFWDTINSIENAELKNDSELKTVTKKLPQTWEIEVEDEKLWISTLEINEGGHDYYWSDNLTVFFTEASLQKYELIENADENYILREEIIMSKVS